jgi:hypothetical protein
LVAIEFFGKNLGQAVNPNAKEATTPSNGFATHRRHRAP